MSIHRALHQLHTTGDAALVARVQAYALMSGLSLAQAVRRLLWLALRVLERETAA